MKSISRVCMDFFWKTVQSKNKLCINSYVCWDLYFKCRQISYLLLHLSALSKFCIFCGGHVSLLWFLKRLLRTIFWILVYVPLRHFLIDRKRTKSPSGSFAFLILRTMLYNYCIDTMICTKYAFLKEHAREL